jgi:hypothetical protein
LAGAGQAIAQDWSPNSGAYGQVKAPIDRDDQGPGPGQATGFLPPRVIVGSLYRRGYRDIDIKRLRGANYIAIAVNPRGARVLVVVDAQTAEITGLRPAGNDRPQPFYDGGGWPPRPWSGPRW